jgi:transcriptional regulator, XRE family
MPPICGNMKIQKGGQAVEKGNKIKERRLALGMTQEELAKKMGFKTKASISRIESGDRNLPAHKIKRLAEVLETTPSYLMSRSDGVEAIQYVGDPLKTAINSADFMSENDIDIAIAYLQRRKTRLEEEKKSRDKNSN